NPQRRGGAHQLLAEVRLDAAVHEQALGRRAHLAGAAERGRRAPRRRPIEVGVLADDGRRDAAELEQDRPQPDALTQPAADRGTAGEGIEVDVAILGEPWTDGGARPVDETQVTRRKAR